jgi:hypothetical protein
LKKFSLSSSKEISKASEAKSNPLGQPIKLVSHADRLLKSHHCLTGSF